MWPMGSRVLGDRVLGTTRLSESASLGHEASCLPSLPLPLPAMQALGLGGTCLTWGPGGKQGPLGFIQVAFRSRLVCRGAHRTQRSTHGAPEGLPPIGWR